MLLMVSMACWDFTMNSWAVVVVAVGGSVTFVVPPGAALAKELGLMSCANSAGKHLIVTL